MRKVSILEKDVVQANPLIEARKEMNLTEMRLFALGLQDIEPHIKDDHFHDVDFHETVIPYSQLVELFGTDNNGNIANLKEKAEKASRSIIRLSSKHGGFGFASIYRKIIYEPDRGLIIHFNDELKPYVLEILDQPYTRYKVKAFFSLSSVYAWRILESLLEKKGYFEQGHKEIFLPLPIEDVRFRLNISDGLYDGRMNNFRKYVLDEPIKEINEKTDYFVWYEVQKTGRKVTGFTFYLKFKDGVKVERKPALPTPTSSTPIEKEEIKKVPDVLAPMPKSDKEEIVRAMVAEGLKKAAINTWIKRDGLEGVKKSFSLAVNHANRRTETKHKGKQRTAYLKYCMEMNISEMNDEDAKLKAEIEEREKRLAREKKENMEAMSDGFVKLGIYMAERAKSETVGYIPSEAEREETEDDETEQKPKELDAATVETIVDLWMASGRDFSDSVLMVLKKYGYTPGTFSRKYFASFLGK